MRIALLANPHARQGGDPGHVERLLRDAGAEVATQLMPCGGLDPDVLAFAPERLVVAGGDGSVGFAAKLAQRHDLTLGVIAAGTANDFARALDLPRDIPEAARLAATGSRTRSLELGRMDGRPFVNVASTGLAPAAARRAEPLKARLGPAAYGIGALAAALREHPVDVRIDADGDTRFDGPVWQLTIACTGHFGGGSSIEDARPDDGRLDVVVVRSAPRHRLVRIGIMLRRGSLRPGRRADELTIGVPDGTPWNVDGELVRSGSNVRFTAERDAFSVVVA